MKKERFVDFLRSAAVFLLFAGMLLLCSVYISMTVNLVDSSLPSFPESELAYIYGEGGMSSEGLSYPIVPYFTAVVSDEYMYGSEYTTDAGEEIWQCFAQVISSAPGGSSKKLSFSDESKKQAYLDSLYSEFQDCFYVKLAYPQKFSVLCALLSDSATSLPENPDFEISDMFLVSGGGAESSIIAVDASGGVMKIYPARNIQFNKELFDTYNDTKISNFSFIKIESNVNLLKNGYFPAFKHPLVLPTIADADVVTNAEENEEDTPLRIAAVLQMNEDNLRTYKGSDGVITVLEGTSRLAVNPDGSFEFDSDDELYDISRFLGHESTDHAFSDMVLAAKKIVGGINAQFSAGVASLTLSSVTYNGERIFFDFDYTVNGLPIMSGEENGLTLEFGADSLYRAIGNLRGYEFSDNLKTDTSQKLAYASMSGEIDDEVVYFGIEYAADGRPLWTVKCIEEVGE